MRTIAVCYKWVRDDADIRVTPARALDMERAGWKISEYDKHAIEAGVRLKAAGAQSLVGLSCGEGCAASAKDALSRGLDAVHYREDAAANGDNRAAATVLAAMARQLGDVDVILCSEGSADEYAQETGPRLAALLDWPCVTYAESIAANGDTLTIARALDDGVETVEVACPVVVAVSPSVNEAPIPSVKAILGAKKKPANACDGPEFAVSEARIETLSVLAPEVNRKRQRLNPDGVSIQDAAAALKKLLDADGAL